MTWLSGWVTDWAPASPKKSILYQQKQCRLVYEKYFHWDLNQKTVTSLDLETIIECYSLRTKIIPSTGMSNRSMAEQRRCYRRLSGNSPLSKQESGFGTQLLETGGVSKVGLDKSLVFSKNTKITEMILGAFWSLILLICRVFKELSEGASVSQLQEGGADQKLLIINGNSISDLWNIALWRPDTGPRMQTPLSKLICALLLLIFRNVSKTSAEHVSFFPNLYYVTLCSTWILAPILKWGLSNGGGEFTLHRKWSHNKSIRFWSLPAPLCKSSGATL